MAEDENYLDCPICLEAYNKGRQLPKMLPCLHTVCQSCLLKMAAKGANDRSASQPRQNRTSRNLNGTAATDDCDVGIGEHLRQSVSLISMNIRSSVSSTKETADPTADIADRNELPPNKSFLCPLCRKKTSTNTVQTNRYVLAHIKSLTKYQEGAPTTSTAVAKDAASSHSSSPAAGNHNFRLDWCTDCVKPADENCAKHGRIPLSQWNSMKTKTINERSYLLLQRLQTHLNSTEQMEKEAVIVSESLKVIIRKLKSNRSKSESMRKILQDVHNSTSQFGKNIDDYPYANQERLLRNRAVTLQEKTKQMNDLCEKTRKLETGMMAKEGDLETAYMWSKDNKMYLSGPTGTFTVTKEDANYAL